MVHLFEFEFDEKDDIVNEWIGVFGDLPEEWKNHNPPKTADCEYLSILDLVKLSCALRPERWPHFCA